MFLTWQAPVLLLAAVLPVLGVYVSFPMCPYQTTKLLNLELHRFRLRTGLVPHILVNAVVLSLHDEALR